MRNREEYIPESLYIMLIMKEKTQIMMLLDTLESRYISVNREEF